MAANLWPFGPHTPYLIACHHVDERDGQTRNLPRGKILWSAEHHATFFWRDFAQANIIRVVGKDLVPPGGLPLEIDMLDWMVEAGVDHILYRISETGLVYMTQPERFLKRGWRWAKGQRPQRCLPLAEWPSLRPIPIPEIPDSRVLVIGGPADDSRAYGMGTDGGTHGWHSDGSYPKAAPSPSTSTPPLPSKASATDSTTSES